MALRVDPVWLMGGDMPGMKEEAVPCRVTMLDLEGLPDAALEGLAKSLAESLPGSVGAERSKLIESIQRVDHEQQRRRASGEGHGSSGEEENLKPPKSHSEIVGGIVERFKKKMPGVDR
jgi:hypothetical protein